MRHILVATHGSMAEGIKASAEVICGPKEFITAMNFYTAKVDYEELLVEYMRGIGAEDELLICTDVAFGSVSQRLLPYLEGKGVFMLTGVNLPALLEAILYDGPFTDEAVERFIQTGREQLHQVKPAELVLDDDEDFY